MDISRRTMLKAAGASALAVAAAEAVAVTDADAAGLGTVKIPRIGVNKPVYAGTSNRVLNRGGFGLWAGSARPGTTGHSILFAHRTSAGGPLRRANLLRIGDKIVANGVTYTVRSRIIVGRSQARKALTYAGRGKRLSLITCTKPNGQPTSTKYRMVIRASV